METLPFDPYDTVSYLPTLQRFANLTQRTSFFSFSGVF
jgi:hypothetical protein